MFFYYEQANTLLGNSIKEPDLCILAKIIETSQFNRLHKTTLNPVREYVDSHTESITFVRMLALEEALFLVE